MASAEKDSLLRYLRAAREAVIWKTEGLSEREIRLPRTPTGVTLLGIVKHCLTGEAGYFGTALGRALPMADELISEASYLQDPQVDWVVTEEESASGLIDLWRRVAEYADATIEELPLDTVARVPWWPAERAEVPLHRIISHVTYDLARHAGHADILREQIDGAAGLRPDVSNLPNGMDWPAYVERLTAIADRF
jgi:hypothetical protein